MAKVKTSMAFDVLTGPVPGMSIVRGRTGMIARRRPVYKKVPSAAQAAAISRLRQATAVWNTFTQSEARAWDDYSATLVRHNTLTGEAYTSIGYNVFTSLVTKFLQVNPTGTIPRNPPKGAFVGDSINLSVEGGLGQITYTANKPNDQTITTELLVQRLRNQRAKPGVAIKSVGFAAFSPGHLTETVALEPGWYEAAYRFVETSTGRQTDWQRLSIIEVR